MKIYAVVGLGYVGLNLAIALAKKNKVIGYDINKTRIKRLQQYQDDHELVSSSELNHPNLSYTSDLKAIKSAVFYIVSVATPALYYDYPDLEPLINVVKDLAQILKRDDIIVFESTVYPGTTQDICIPLLEQGSGLKNGEDFHVGYSPERINPGDEEHTLENMTKIVAAENPHTLKTIRAVYEGICGQVYPVSSIAAAEAAKLLENAQRDVNIALMNEFTKVMHALNLNTHEIIEAAKTKWGFIPFQPGFVGGHCISIDPHYLAFKAKRHGVYPDLLLTARKVNDGMTQFVLQSLLKILLENKLNSTQLNIALLGITYKPNVVDTRNSLSLKLLKELSEYGLACQVHEPLLDPAYFHMPLTSFEALANLNVVIIVVGHDYYRNIGLKSILNKCVKPAVIIDIPNLFVSERQQHKDMIYWGL